MKPRWLAGCPTLEHWVVRSRFKADAASKVRLDIYRTETVEPRKSHGAHRQLSPVANLRSATIFLPFLPFFFLSFFFYFLLSLIESTRILTNSRLSCRQPSNVPAAPCQFFSVTRCEAHPEMRRTARTASVPETLAARTTIDFEQRGNFIEE
jgi:hypothetical protein